MPPGGKRLLARVVEGSTEDDMSTVHIGLPASEKKDDHITTVAWTTPEGGIRLMAQLMCAFDQLCEEGDPYLRVALDHIMAGKCDCDECVHAKTVASIVKTNLVEVDQETDVLARWGDILTNLDDDVDPSEMH